MPHCVIVALHNAFESFAEFAPRNESPLNILCFAGYFITFKGKPDGTSLATLRERLVLPPWVHLQVQESGSYREEDVLDALRVLLPVASSTRESLVVLLDWYSAHRTEAVIELIEQRGHVVLWHGGGCTPFTQINDTHLHANLQRT